MFHVFTKIRLFQIQCCPSPAVLFRLLFVGSSQATSSGEALQSDVYQFISHWHHRFYIYKNVLNFCDRFCCHSVFDEICVIHTYIYLDMFMYNVFKGICRCRFGEKILFLSIVVNFVSIQKYVKPTHVCKLSKSDLVIR